MATLAYPVGQTTSTYNSTKFKSVRDTLKPSGKSQVYSSFPATKFVLDTLKLNGNTQAYSKFLSIQIPLDTKKLSSKLNNAAWVPSTSSNLKATYWIPVQMGSVGKTNLANLKNTINTSNWVPTIISFGQVNLNSLKVKDYTIGILSTPYSYESLANGSMTTEFVTIANQTSFTPVETVTSNSLLTIKVGPISAFGVAPNHGWVN